MHVSTFGDTFHGLRRIVRRSRRPQATEREIRWREGGWRLVVDERKRLALLDPFGYVHRIPSAGSSRHLDPMARGVAHARSLAQVMATGSRVLAAALIEALAVWSSAD